MLYLSIFRPTHGSFPPVAISQQKLSYIAKSIILVGNFAK